MPMGVADGGADGAAFNFFEGDASGDAGSGAGVGDGKIQGSPIPRGKRSCHRVEPPRRFARPAHAGRRTVRAVAHRSVDGRARPGRQTRAPGAQTGSQGRRRETVPAVREATPSDASPGAAPQAPLALAAHAVPQGRGHVRGRGPRGVAVAVFARQDGGFSARAHLRGATLVRFRGQDGGLPAAHVREAGEKLGQGRRRAGVPVRRVARAREAGGTIASTRCDESSASWSIPPPRTRSRRSRRRGRRGPRAGLSSITRTGCRRGRGRCGTCGSRTIGTTRASTSRTRRGRRRVRRGTAAAAAAAGSGAAKGRERRGRLRGE